jgi:hypothetical protein
MVVGAKRGSEIIKMKYPAIIPAYYAQWFLYNKKVPNEYIIIRVHRIDVYHRLTIYKLDLNILDNFLEAMYEVYLIGEISEERFLYLLYNAKLQLIKSIQISKEDVTWAISNYENKNSIKEWLREKFNAEKQLKDVISSWKIGVNKDALLHRILSAYL